MTRPASTFGIPLEEAASFVQGIAADPFVYVGGQVQRRDDEVSTPGLSAQEKFVGTVAQIDRVLADLDCSREQLVQAQVYVDADLLDSIDVLSTEHRRAFGDIGIASCIVGLKLLNPDYKIEISATAVKRDGKANMPTVAPAASPYDEKVGQAPAVRVGDHVYVSGQMALDASGEILCKGDVAGQLAVAVQNFGNALSAVGASFDDVVSFTTFLTVVPDAAAMGEIAKSHRDAFAGQNRPSGAMLSVSALPISGALVMMTGTAVATQRS